MSVGAFAPPFIYMLAQSQETFYSLLLFLNIFYYFLTILLINS